jgi:DNA polymerase-3 subunit delta'
VQALGAAPDTAQACARLSLGDLGRARELAGEQGVALRAAGERLARAALEGVAAAGRPWLEVLAAVRERGEAVREQLEAEANAQLELYPRKERKRVETEWSERIRRARRRAETGSLDLALQVASLWYADLAAIAWGAGELVRNRDRSEQLHSDGGRDPRRLMAAVDLVEETRRRFQLNVSEELACEALAYRLEAELGG